MKITEPKIKNICECTFNECINNNEFSKVYIKDNTKDTLDLREYSFDECVFENIDFSNININDISLNDVILKNCDLSNKHFNNTFISRVKFINCKLVGVTFIDSSIKDMIIEDSKCEYLNISNTNISGLIINNSNLKESSFNSCKILNSELYNDDFSNCMFLDSNLKDVDFSKSDISGIRFDKKSLDGIIINKISAYNILSILNVKVVDKMDKESILKLLDEKGIWYEITNHGVVNTMDELDKYDLPYPLGNAKNLFLKSDKCECYYLLTVSGKKRVNLKEFKKNYNTRSLSFASNDEMLDILGVYPGCVTSFGLINDKRKVVKFYLDSYFINDYDIIGLHPFDNTVTLWIKVIDLIDVLKSFNIEVNTFDV